MDFVVTYYGRGVREFYQVVRIFANGQWKLEAYRGVIEAGRKTKTKYQRADHPQMGTKPGQYQGYVFANTKERVKRSNLSHTISESANGTDVEIYTSLRV